MNTPPRTLSNTSLGSQKSTPVRSNQRILYTEKINFNFSISSLNKSHLKKSDSEDSEETKQFLEKEKILSCIQGELNNKKGTQWSRMFLEEYKKVITKSINANEVNKGTDLELNNFEKTNKNEVDYFKYMHKLKYVPLIPRIY